MEKTQYSQLELFKEAQRLGVEKRSLHSSLLHFIRTYEKVTLALICLLVVALAAFSLGVEKGKKIPLAPAHTALFKEPAAAVPPPATLPATLALRALQPQVIAPKNNAIPPKGNFTIQVASYQNKLFANKEADSLRKSGYSPLITLQGKLTVLCIGSFNNKKSAEIMLSKLKKQYQGCYIRRL